MLSVGNLYNPDVRYSFNIPIEDKPQQFFWDAYGPWQECSRLCQGEWEAQGISKMRWWEWSVINGVVRLKMGWNRERRRGKHWARGPGERGLSGWTWQVHARRIGLEQVIKVRLRSILWQISLFGITPDMSDCLGRQRWIAGKLEKPAMCYDSIPFLRSSFFTFWHRSAWTTNSKHQTETNEFTAQGKQLTCNALSTFWFSDLYSFFGRLRHTKLSQSWAAKLGNMRYW